MHDITATMFNKRFMEELFKPQELYSKKAMRTVFDRLAHASIMRLNAASMDKLYDLMTMAFKYQVSLCLRPSDVLLVTLNHMDAIRAYVGESSTLGQVEFVYKLLIQHYGSLSSGEFMLIRQTLLSFFQDMHIRVSIFLKDKVQSSNGRFILPPSGVLPWGSDPPGTIRLFNSSGDQVKTTQFNPGGKYTPMSKPGSFEIKSSRVIKLGTNMYTVSRPAETAAIPSSVKPPTSSEVDMSTPNPLATAQLDLLSRLIGQAAAEKTAKRPEFRLNLFNTDAEEEQAATVQPQMAADPGSKIVNIDASKKNSAELSRILGELKVDASSEDHDLLDLMDIAQ
ncbi:hypothetical protein CAPTEDRAFT_165139 [Capitella teleta]|uniref:Protein OSCP1 n=1 Tax=Capitella teleta TaxID=283909 RepID=R7TVS5_CAPTE|nr:hypothetical protein CAPTEDRAFT_165139 [Capitella teleta]|eukprot:ELT95571.1 hypothetical protein CAPTEDRAFT_165139 [Capitella teleta]